MRIARVETLIACGPFSKSKMWRQIRKQVHSAIENLCWPKGAKNFTIHPQSGKKRGEGNGVKPLKDALMIQLSDIGWALEHPIDFATVSQPGRVDAFLATKRGNVVIEWETGNISSSHRSLNKMCLGLMKKAIVSGTLVVPSRALYHYLTDRVGNWNELVPYLDFWRAMPVESGVLEIVVVEHDATSVDVPRIPKGTDGRALL